jgi:Helitron helicase-like domain at N-terminus
MTTNPKWPEIVSQLQAGQTAADAPIIVCRAFRNRLAALCKFLHSRFGRVVYLITVVEFQKRGLPHAHLLVKLSPEIPLNSIDDVVRAELPSKEEDPELYQLVNEFMRHKESHLDSANSRCNKKGKCVYGFPHPVREQTTVDEYGRVLYRRRGSESAWIASYIPALLKLLKCHINVDICFTANVVLYLYKYLFKG